MINPYPFSSIHRDIYIFATRESTTRTIDRGEGDRGCRATRFWIKVWLKVIVSSNDRSLLPLAPFWRRIKRSFLRGRAMKSPRFRSIYKVGFRLRDFEISNSQDSSFSRGFLCRPSARVNETSNIPPPLFVSPRSSRSLFSIRVSTCPRKKSLLIEEIDKGNIDK